MGCHRTPQFRGHVQKPRDRSPRADVHSVEEEHGVSYRDLDALRKNIAKVELPRVDSDFACPCSIYTGRHRRSHSRGPMSAGKGEIRRRGGRAISPKKEAQKEGGEKEKVRKAKSKKEQFVDEEARRKVVSRYNGGAHFHFYANTLKKQRRSNPHFDSCHAFRMHGLGL